MKTLIYAFLLCVVWSISVNAQTPTPSPEASPVNSNVSSPATTISLKDYREVLDNERKLLDDQSEKYYTRIDSLMNRVIWGLGLVIVTALGLVTWRFGKTRRELEELVHEQVKNQASAFVESDMKALRATVESEVSALRSSIQELETEVGNLLAFQKRPVVWVFSGTEMNAQPEHDALRAAGLNIQIVIPPKNKDFEIGEPTVVIFSFDGTDEGRERLERIVTKLKGQPQPVYLLIYTYNPAGPEVRLNEPERAILKDFHWSVPVNFPTTLVAQTQWLIRGNRKI